MAIPRCSELRTYAHSDDAAATSEPTAARVTLQRLSPVFPPANFVNSAATRELPTCQCSGNLSPYEQ
ncbi:MAG: hypothetical protein R3E39_23225 [Anaerolineae bacterium]